MATSATNAEDSATVNIAEPRDLQPDTEAESMLRHESAREGAEHTKQTAHTPRRWEREAETHPKTGPEDQVTKSSRIYFFIMLAIIAAAIALFLVLHPQGGG